MAYEITLLPGDGIGPEVMDEGCRIINWFESQRDLKFDKTFDLVGGAAFDKHGIPLSDGTLEKANKVDAIYIATPHTLHAEWSIKAAGKGKHILCEKPAAVNLIEGQKVINIVRDSGIFYIFQGKIKFFFVFSVFLQMF